MVSLLTIKIIDTIADVSLLQKILDDLGDTVMPSLFLAPSLKKYWLLSFFQAYGISRNLAITVVFEDDFPRLVLPLQRKDETCLEFLCDETSDYNDFLYSEINVKFLSYALKYWISQGIRKIHLNQLPQNAKDEREQHRRGIPLRRARV